MEFRIIITGGAGFIGSELVQVALEKGFQVLVLDALTYAGSLSNLDHAKGHQGFEFIEGKICDGPLVEKLMNEFKPNALINLAAESHVDNSIAGSLPFLETNIMGTHTLLEKSRAYFDCLPDSKKSGFRFLQVSTDEVYGDLGSTGAFTETSPYLPNSPYSASKAAGDHLVRAWHRTYQLPTIITNCSNNYGPRQYEEKLIPLMIKNALLNLPLPVYGDGSNVRDWIHVNDHCQGILQALKIGKPGESYCFGGGAERSNISLVKSICKILDSLAPRAEGGSYEQLITYVTDRKGHDFRYAIDDKKSQKDLGYTRKHTDFEYGLQKTVEWYLSRQKMITEENKK